MSPMRGVSILELAQTIPRNAKANRGEKREKITDGVPRGQKYPLAEGYHVVRPMNMLSLLVPVQELRGETIVGFQRKLDVGHARKIAYAIGEGQVMPTVEVALYRSGAWITDGQHRVIAAIMANAELPTLARKMNADQMRALFASQGRAKNVNPSLIVLSADDPYSEYVQDAVTANDHPWSPLVTHHLSSSRRLTPAQMREAVVLYATNSTQLRPSTQRLGQMSEQRGIDRMRADQLAELIAVFGTKEENPSAYRAIVWRALIRAAVVIIRRHNDTPEAVKRWKKHMPRFPFHQYEAVRSTEDYVPLLISHWNKKLADNRRVPMP